MSYFRIIPDELIDWIEQRKNPERYYRLVILLLRLSNWGDGTYNDGVEVKRGQVRITERKLAQLLGYSKSAVNRLFSSLRDAGWIKIDSQNNLTIISLCWITDKVKTTKAGHPEASKRDTSTEKAGHEAGHDNTTEKRAITTQAEHQAGHKPAESGTPESVEAGIRNIRSNIEIKETEIKEKKNIEAGNSSAEQKKIDVEEKNRNENLGEENKEITPSLIALVTQNIINEFKLAYKRKFNRYPLIDTASIKRVQETLVNSASNKEELKDLANHLLQKIPDFFKLTDKWIREKGYSFFAFSWRVGDLLSQPVSYQATNTPNIEFACKGGWK